jgi:hypothetical protein
MSLEKKPMGEVLCWFHFEGDSRGAELVVRARVIALPTAHRRPGSWNSIQLPGVLMGRCGNEARMRRLVLVSLFMVCAGVANAQPVTVPLGQDHPGSACPPGVGANAPTVGRETTRPLSDQLAESKGVICPPAGVDPEIRVTPPEGGAIRVIPPPGSPGGNPSVQPK